MLILSNNIECVNDTKRFLSFNFDIKDIGHTYMILGIKLIRHEHKYMV